MRPAERVVLTPRPSGLAALVRLGFVWALLAVLPTSALAWWNTALGLRRRITLINSGQPSNLANFPVLVRLDSTRVENSAAPGAPHRPVRSLRSFGSFRVAAAGLPEVEPSERSSGGSRGSHPRPNPVRGLLAVLAHLLAPEEGLYRLRFEDVFPVSRRGIAARSLRLSHQGQAVAHHLEPDKTLLPPGSSLYFLSPGSSRSPSGDVVYERSVDVERPPVGRDVGILGVVGLAGALALRMCRIDVDGAEDEA